LERQIEEDAMPNVRANGIGIEYEEFGDKDARPLLLIMGLGGQMVMWHERACNQLADRGFRVIRYDNRDVGLSTKFHEQCPNPGKLLEEAMQGKSIDPPYTLDDMAQDAAGLLRALGIQAAHVIGASMGGMIAQLLAISSPSQMLSLTSIMSTTGDPDLPQADPEVLGLLMMPVPSERNARIEQAVETARLLSGPGFEFDDATTRELAEISLDRDPDAEGMARQLLAIAAAGSRRQALGSVAVPTLVIHGDADPLIPIAGGFDTADAIPGSRMLVIEGMGHELPEGAWPRVIDAFVELAQTPSAAASA
jgi:pimeloyl-ACP methyl ester carboxylesterase